MVRGLKSYAQRGRAALSGGESEDSAAEEGEASTTESASAVGVQPTVAMGVEPPGDRAQVVSSATV